MLEYLKKVLIEKDVDLEVSLFLKGDDICISVASENGTGVTHKVFKTGDIGAVIASYVEAYCDEEGEED